MADPKGNELVATTGGGDSGPEDIFSKLGPLLDMASEVRMNYKKGAASSVFDVTIRDLFRLPRSVRLEISKQRSSKMAPTVSLVKDLVAVENAILKCAENLNTHFHTELQGTWHATSARQAMPEASEMIEITAGNPATPKMTKLTGVKVSPRRVPLHEQVVNQVFACFLSPAAATSVILVLKIIGLLMAVSVLCNPHLLGVLLGKLFLACGNAIFVTTQSAVEKILTEEENTSVPVNMRQSTSLSPWLLSFNGLGIAFLIVWARSKSGTGGS